MPENRLVAGEPAPLFTLSDANEQQVSLKDFAGRKTVIYFYPAASTPACAKQACDFRDNLNTFAAAGYQVLGISPDEPKALAKFAAEDSLNFPLLADPDHRVAEAYRAWGEKKNYGRTYQGLIRSTFVVDEKGLIEVAQYNVRATGHVAKLRRDLGLD
ncbi:thioredoxin-dependent thiol peroxidase [Psychromicrobium lacuslunae]|uniref:thioredoxin-dependent peroxiredoxin n=1 Tax=Psychromicrobium lacuslunae TaxID=1618207 RepID=A0A0D4BY81_9MICC|nr:thioredoxin-dependent thiol peroxidase [Psychromicrobium lacuslunae]AJT41274.1 peroxiredoxin [Psychromicrobium lacuslunae]